MKKRRSPRRAGITDRFIRDISARLEQNQHVRRFLPLWGRIHIDRQLPFLCLYRRPTRRPDAGTERLATGEASYMICSGERRLRAGLADLVRAVVRIMNKHFGAFLILELWSGKAPETEGPVTTAFAVPDFRLVVPKGRLHDPLTEEFAEALGRISLGKRKARVKVDSSGRPGPRDIVPLMTHAAASEIDCRYYGLEVSPIYRDPVSGEIFPTLLRRLRGSVNRALLRIFFEFAKKHTTQRPPHFHALGRRAVVSAVWEADRILTEVSESFDFLLQLTPVNSEQAWRMFRRRRYQRNPIFQYRPLPAEPILLKRRLYQAPVERVEDSALGQIFREKLVELDRKITMLQERNTARFRHESAQLYGEVDARLLERARQLLDRLSPRGRHNRREELIDAGGFARLAVEEIERCRARYPRMNAAVEIRDDVVGLVVSGRTLLIGRSTLIPASRVQGIVQHEVGTHLVTYFNGRAQKLRQLSVGLAGYDALQEGLAVLAEYLTGGMSGSRLRTLAARVLAVHRMMSGAEFVETFRELVRDCGIPQHAAFQVVMRAFRGGGLSKDAVYLRGLCELLEYFGRGGEMEPLLFGKIAMAHVPVIKELRWRKVLRRPPLLPSYLSLPDAQARLERLRAGVEPLDLVVGR